jgi:hypothetical protein
VLAGAVGPTRVRFVTHKDITAADIRSAREVTGRVLAAAC